MVHHSLGDELESVHFVINRRTIWVEIGRFPPSSALSDSLLAPMLCDGI